MNDALNYERGDPAKPQRHWSPTAILGFLLCIVGPVPALVIENLGFRIERVYLLFVPLSIGLTLSLFATLTLCTSRGQRKHGFLLATTGAVAGSAWLSLYLYLMRL